MKAIARIAGLNLLVFTLYAATILSADKPIAFMMFFLLHSLFCLGAALYAVSKSRKYDLLGWIISFLLIILVGFSACMGLTKPLM